MRDFGTQLERAARSDATVFITGESGTGKEMVARAIHDASARHASPFIAVNCGAISSSLVHAQLFGHEKGSFTGALAQTAGYFETASGGTLFLDEVTEMSDALQVQFLRVLESGTYQRVGGTELLRADVRIVCATNRDPYAAVDNGELRQDFLHRLLVVPLRVPPLREREDDVLLLAQRFLDELNAAHQTRKRFSPRMLDALALYDWPGNVRELRNVVQRAFIMSDSVVEAEFRRRTPAATGPDVSDGTLKFPVGTPLSQAQRDVILATLAHHDGDKQRTADTLGVSLKTLYNRLGAYSADGPQ
ncbi:sigma-54 interaction domain-containing protein [Bordetella genomosp. 2]|uniref:Sigma-54-dependent Fis family transcriptional regulator n=1 Tax=Bordetella genomosp. 2 TaxID=1983456 RepID=A0A261VSC8_9BORD|nr:sigma-54 dependent transcriptional regulator [Bordetella genomosp. 2]OZI76747.1 sigma-54-dependent Fis family transcriptional regulator [Bordetella genomosp. 2]